MKDKDDDMARTTNKQKWTRTTKPIRFATWNFTSFPNNDTEIIMEMKEHNVDICSLPVKPRIGRRTKMIWSVEMFVLDIPLLLWPLNLKLSSVLALLDHGTHLFTHVVLGEPIIKFENALYNCSVFLWCVLRDKNCTGSTFLTTAVPAPQKMHFI